VVAEGKKSHTRWVTDLDTHQLSFKELIEVYTNRLEVEFAQPVASIILINERSLNRKRLICRHRSVPIHFQRPRSREEQRRARKQRSEGHAADGLKHQRGRTLVVRKVSTCLGYYDYGIYILLIKGQQSAKVPKRVATVSAQGPKTAKPRCDHTSTTPPSSAIGFETKVGENERCRQYR